MDIKKLHQDNDYIVTVEKLPKVNGCKVTFPANIILEKPREKIEFVYIIHDELLEIFKNSKTYAEIVMPSYITRLSILADFISNMDIFGFDRGLAQYLDEKGKEVEEVTHLLKPPQDIKSENRLSSLFYKTTLGQDCSKEASEVGVLQGYKILKTILEREFINV